MMAKIGDRVRTHLARVEHLRDVALHGHEARVGRLAHAICHRMGLPKSFANKVHRAAALHDIGKITIADGLLKKPGALDAGEWQVMRQHCEISRAILSGSDDPVLEMAAEIAWSHHECFDGSGYPRGLAGEAIPLGGRITAICDVYDALRENRVYRQGLSHATAVDIITKGDGRVTPAKFDPTVLAAFTALSPDLAWEHERDDRFPEHRLDPKMVA